MNLLGGLALFIYGMRTMGEGLQKVAGDRLRKFLETLTSVPIVGVLAGTVVTAIIQSSSATTIMVVGFVNAGLMTLRQAIGVIMGANIGTTITAQLIAFKLDKFVMPIIAVGFAMYFISKSKRYKYLGQVILGFGVLFLGLNIMSDSMYPLREYEGFTKLMADFGRYPLVGVVVGIIMTVLIQSSSATIGMLIAVASQGLVPLDAAIPILLGDNIGTCVTAVLASVGTSLTARRAALAHVFFNTFGAIIFLTFLPFFKEFVLYISPANDIARQIANAHTSFNLVNTIIFLPLIRLLEKVVCLAAPGEEVQIRRGPIYLDERVLTSPSIALSLATKEIIRMGKISFDNLEKAVQSFVNKDYNLIKQIKDMEEVIDELEKEITFYLAKTAQYSMTPSQSEKHGGLIHAVNDFERVGDHAENIADLAQKRIEENLPFSDQAINELENMHKYLMDTLYLCIPTLEKEDRKLAEEIVEREHQIDLMEKKLRKNHIERLNAGLCYPASGVVYLDLLSNLERVGDHAHNIAQVILGEIFPTVELNISKEGKEAKDEEGEKQNK
ncbi:MAG: Na/Pi cotransporter family protein [Clostridia bacterium]|nr:Na/Pi cotransporter family protein [Clostridia bacterium]